VLYHVTLFVLRLVLLLQTFIIFSTLSIPLLAIRNRSKTKDKTYPAKAEPTKGVIAPGVFDALLKKLKSCLIFEFFSRRGTLS